MGFQTVFVYIMDHLHFPFNLRIMDGFLSFADYQLVTHTQHNNNNANTIVFITEIPWNVHKKFRNRRPQWLIIRGETVDFGLGAEVLQLL